jgi:hypothetical protein
VSHWYSGWKFWPEAPKGPVGAAYRQLTWLRPYRPGFPRILLSVIGVIGFLIPMYSAIIVLLNPSSPLVPRLLVAGSVGLIAAGVGILVARFFATGIYVNDLGIRVVTMRGMVSLPWTDVADVSNSDGRTGVLGLPFGSTNGHVVVLTTRDSGPVTTPVTSTGLDFVGRDEAYDAAALAVERWWRDAGEAQRKDTVE